MLLMSTHPTAPSATRWRAIASYLAVRAIPLDPQVVLRHFERVGSTEDLFTVEDDFYALLDRFAWRGCANAPPWPAQPRQAAYLVHRALATLVERIEVGRIDGHAAQLDDHGCGCILVLLASSIGDPAWRTLREHEEVPRLIERFVWHVRPGETHRTCPSLALVRAWTLLALG
jgi:hypothetical protein